MNNRKNPFEEEFVNSTVYQVAEKVAEGLNKAASEVAKAVEEIPKAVGNNKNRSYNRVEPPVPPQPQEPPPVQPPPDYRSAPGNYGYTYHGNRSSQKTNGPNNTTYHYSYHRAQGPRPVPPPQMPKNHKAARNWMRFGFPLIAMLTYCVYTMVFRNVPQLIPVLGFGAAGYLIGEISGRAAFPKKKEKRVRPEEVAAPPKREPKKEEAPKPSTGNAELDKIISEGDDYIRKLRAANDAIQDEGVSTSIDRMEAASRGIFEYVREHPERIPQIKKFMNYYLPTTLKLLNSYERLSRQAVKGENISATMFDIEGMMQTIATAFEKQLDGLFSAEAMDIQADITVFETILEQEGLKEDETPSPKS